MVGALPAEDAIISIWRFMNVIHRTTNSGSVSNGTVGEAEMGTFSIVHWLILILYIIMIVAYFVAIVRILRRAGYSGWWSLLSLIPVANVIGLWQFSKAPWPGVETRPGVTDVFR